MATENFSPEQSLRVQYGRIDPQTGVFVMRKISQDKQLASPVVEFGPIPIALMAEFDYVEGNNFIMIELFNRVSGRQVLTKVVPLIELPSNRFVERRLIFQGR